MDFTDIDSFIERAGAHRVIEAAAPSITDARRARIERVLHGRLSGLEIAAERPEHPHNAAAIVRTSEALGLLRVHVVAAGPRALEHRWVTQGAHRWLHTHEHADTACLVRDLRARQVCLAGAVMGGALEVDALPVDRPLCVVFGTEGSGLSWEALQACDLTFRVPMFGMGESLNLSVSAAITLHSLVRRRRALLGSEGDLAGQDYLREKARYYANSVERRLLVACFGP